MASLRPGPAHFRVVEIPAYAPCGAGEHLWIEIEKENLTTDAAAAALARACGRAPRDVGFAGRKDRHAITRQWLSVHFGDADDLGRIEVPRSARLEVREVSRHRNKLKPGHLRGNRFDLDLDAPASLAPGLRERLARLGHEGARNRFGSQRFGTHGSSLRIARAWASGDLDFAVAHVIDPAGGWRPGEPLPAARPPGPVGVLLAALRRDPHDPAGALRAAGKRYRKLIASAAQAAVFNAVLDAREQRGLLHRLRAGDIAVGPRGGPFLCTASDLEDLQRRVAPGVLEIRASAPLPGHKLSPPGDDVDREERAWSAPAGIDWAWLSSGPLASSGERRPLVIPFLEPPVLETTTDGLTLRMALPAGAFATEVLTQIGVELPASRAAAAPG